MSSEEIDEYLADLDEHARSTLESLRRTILSIIPEAEQGIAYRMPAFKVRGKNVAGFAAFKDHLSYVPYSGSVFAELKKETAAYEVSEGGGMLRFSIDKPPPKTLVKKLLAVRMRQAFAPEP